MYPNERWPEWLLVAWSLRGQAEQAAGNNGAVELMFHDIAPDDHTIPPDEVPWCAAFVGSCLVRAGLPSSRSALAKSYLKYGVPVGTPLLGAIAVFNRGTDPNAGHVGFVVGDNGETVSVLGGNQGNKVSVVSYPKTALVGLVMPKAAVAKSAPELVFEDALALLEDIEGGWSDHPADTPTMYGITQETLSAWRGYRVPKEEVKALSRAESRLIYKVMFFYTGHCDRLPAGVARVHFDACVNHGPGRAARLLQSAVSAYVDGEIGPQTIIRTTLQDRAETVNTYLVERLAFYRSLAKWPIFGNGWTSRMLRLKTAALADLKSTTYTEHERETPMSDDDITAIGRTNNTGSGAAPTSEMAAPPKWWLASKTVWGVGITFASTVLPVILSFYGIHITAADVTTLGDKAFDVIQIAGGLVGTILALYGRTAAVQGLASRTFQVRL
jgi:uncharacterized protein (TIGR02594 family)